MSNGPGASAPGTIEEPGMALRMARTGPGARLAALGVTGVAGIAWASLPPPLPAPGTPPQVERVKAKVLTPTRMEFRETTIDVGTVFDHEKIELEFEFTNTGEHVLEISNVRSSCGCTAAEPEKLVYEPGESGKINVTFDPKGKHGSQRRTVYIDCNDLSGRDVELYVVGNVVRLVQVTPETVSLGTVMKGEGGTATFTVTGRSPDFEATRATVRNNLDLFDVRQVGTEDIEEDGEKRRRTTFEVSFKPSKTVGRIDDELTIRTNDPRRPIVNAPLLVSVQGDIAVAPMRFTVGRPKLGESFEREFTVANRKGEAFELLGVEFADGPVRMEFEARPADPEKKDVYKVRVRVTAERVHPRVSQDIIVRTDVEGEGEIRIPVMGSVRAR